MKRNHLLKSLLLLCALIVGSMNVWAETKTYQHVFNAKPSTGSSVALSSINWAIEATNLGSYNSTNYAGVQLGSKNNDGSITLTSKDNWGEQSGSTVYGYKKITEVRLWLNLGGTSVTPTVTIDGKAATSDGTTVVKNSSAGTDWTKATKVTFTPAANGNTGIVVINVATVKAGYICAMEIDCEEMAKTDPTISFTNGSVRVGQNLDLSPLFTSNSDGDVTYSITAGDSYASLVGSTLTGVAEGKVTVKAVQAASGSYNAGEATATIDVTPALVLSSIAVTTAPDKIDYTQGETFDPAGMVVTATYTDTSVDDVTAGITYTPDGALTTSVTEITISYTENGVTKTTTQAITVNEVVDYVTLPFSWAGGTSSGLEAVVGVTASGLGGDYADSNAPYRVKLDNTGDYILIKTNAQPGQVTIGVKMIGGASASSITVQGSSDDETYTDLETLSISGSQNDELTLKTTKSFAADVRYVKLVFTKGSNVGVGPISISLPPAEPSDPVVSGSTVTLTTTDNMDGWRAFYNGKKGYEVDANTTIYTVSATSGTAVTLKAEAGKIIPSGNAVVLKTTDAGHSMTLTENDTPATLGTNILTVSDGENDVDGYRLGYGAEDVIAFYRYTATKPAAGIVYIPKTSMDAPSLALEFEETTAIKNVNNDKADATPRKMLKDGRMVVETTEGIFLMNGSRVK